MSSFSADCCSEPCPFWRRGYCVADKRCKLLHDPHEGGQLQESYLSQILYNNENKEPLQYSASAVASAIYGGGAQPVMYGYGYYNHGAMIPVVIGQPTPKNYKTVACRHFMRGHCMRGNTCGFRHSEFELNTTIIPTAVTSAYGQFPTPDLAHIQPLSCRRWLQGNCALGDRCTYRHSPISGVKRSLSPERSVDHAKVQKTL